MSDLIEFLRARLAEDESAALAASGPKARFTQWDLSEWHGREEPHSLIGQGTAGQPYALGHFTSSPIPTVQAAHIARHDPARVLAEVEAKREVIRLAERAYDFAPTFTTGFASAMEQALRMFAQPFAGHPDYREDWRP